MAEREFVGFFTFVELGKHRIVFGVESFCGGRGEGVFDAEFFEDGHVKAILFYFS